MGVRSLGGGSCDFAQDDAVCVVLPTTPVVLTATPVVLHAAPVVRPATPVILREVAGSTRADNAARSPA